MKKGVSVFVITFMFVLLAANLVSAAGTLKVSWSEDSREDVKNALEGIENPLVKTVMSSIGVYIFGMYSIEDMSDKYSIATIIILFFLIWLILFVGISDILHYFSAFSPWASWLIGFAIAVVAANIGIVQMVVYWTIFIFAFLGAIAIFAGILAAFVLFIGVSWGSQKAGLWKSRMMASKGRNYIQQGVQTAADMGRATENAANPRGSGAP